MAFQGDAFQNDAFQIASGISSDLLALELSGDLPRPAKRRPAWSYQALADPLQFAAPTVDRWASDYPAYLTPRKVKPDGGVSHALEASFFPILMSQWEPEYPAYLKPRHLHQEGGLSHALEPSFFPVPVESWEPGYPEKAPRRRWFSWPEWLSLVDFSVPSPPSSGSSAAWTKRKRPWTRSR